MPKALRFGAGQRLMEGRSSAATAATAAIVSAAAVVVTAATVVATGGLAKDLIKSCKRDITYNGDLVLYGLKVLYEKNKK